MKMARSGSSGSGYGSDEREREREREKEKERLRERERAHHQLIQRWMPTIDAAASSPPHSKLAAWPPALRQKTPAPSPRA